MTPALPILLGASTVIAFEAGFELSGIERQLLAWNHVPRALSLWPATNRQWPLPELMLGLVWSLPALAWFRRDRAPLAWLDPARAPASVITTTMRVLALSALVDLAFLAYNSIFTLIGLDASADFPSWLAG